MVLQSPFSSPSPFININLLRIEGRLTVVLAIADPARIRLS
jgi:hypothetical protein